jgi:hypothetical protein
LPKVLKQEKGESVVVSTLTVVLFLSSPIYAIGDSVLVIKGEHKDCKGTVLDVVQAYNGDLYDIGLTSCPNMYMKGHKLIEQVPEGVLAPIP